MVATWWQSGGKVVAKWWQRGGKVVAKWWQSGGKVVKHSKCETEIPIFMSNFL